MSKKSNDIAVAVGVCTIVGALTAYSVKKKWEEVHTFAVVVGTVLTILGGVAP